MSLPKEREHTIILIFSHDHYCRPSLCAWQCMDVSKMPHPSITPQTLHGWNDHIDSKARRLWRVEELQVSAFWLDVSAYNSEGPQEDVSPGGSRWRIGLDKSFNLMRTMLVLLSLHGSSVQCDKMLPSLHRMLDVEQEKNK